MIRFRPLAAFVLLGLLGCQRPKLSSDEVAGIWVMKEESRRVLPTTLNKISARIVFSGNGTFIASEMPCLLSAGRCQEELDAGSGRWKLTYVDGVQEVQIDFYAITGGNTRLPVPYGTQLEISKPRSNVTLQYYLGDPEEGRRLEFEKR